MRKQNVIITTFNPSTVIAELEAKPESCQTLARALESVVTIRSADCSTIISKDECITTTKHKSGHSHGHRCVWSECDAVCVQGDDSYDCKW